MSSVFSFSSSSSSSSSVRMATAVLLLVCCVSMMAMTTMAAAAGTIRSDVSQLLLCDKASSFSSSSYGDRNGKTTTVVPLQFSDRILVVPGVGMGTMDSVAAAAAAAACQVLPMDPAWMTYLTRLDEPRHSQVLTTLAARENVKVTVLEGTESAPYAVVSVHPDAVLEFDLATQELSKELLKRSEKPRKSSARQEKKREGLRLAHSANFRKDEKDDIIASLDEDEYYDKMLYLTGEESFELDGKSYTTETRYTHTEENKYAAAYILDWFDQFGFDETFYQEFNYAGTTTQNIIAVKTGSSHPDEIVVVGAHMDSTSQSPSTLAPGCVDNGSGTDGVMLIAKAFANVTTSRTIHFIAFGCEEQGLIGSEYYVDELDRNGYNVVSALTMDMIGYSGSYYGVIIEGTSDPDIMELMEVVEDNCREYAPNLNRVLRYFSYGSDHVSFQRAGIPAMLAIEEDDVDYPGYHRTTDAINYLDVSQASDIMRGIAGALYDLAV